MEFLNLKYFGNTILDYLFFLLSLAVCAVLIHFIAAGL